MFRYVLALLLCTATCYAEPFDFQANLRALHDHPWMATEIALANRTDKIYGDIGQHNVFAWTVTRQRKHLDAAATKLLAFIKVEPLPATNDIREYFAETVILYRMIKDDLTAEQNKLFEQRFNRWAEITCAINTAKYYGGWNYADSDLTTGQYLGLLLCDQTFGWEWTKRPEVIKAREAIKDYVEKSKGGVWVESSAYNIGTLQFLLLGCYAAGIEHFPEVQKLLPDLVEWQLLSLTPDFKQSYQWSDVEDPRSLNLNRRLALFGILHGLTGDARLLKAIDNILAGKTYKDYAHLSWRLIYFARPIEIVDYLHVAEGNGHFIYKRENAMLMVHFPKRLGVHHEAEYVCDIQLYVDGWILTRPLGYGLTAVSGDASNAPLFAGMSAMLKRGPISCEETNEGCIIKGGSDGPRYEEHPKYYNPPPSFVEKYERTIKYDYPAKLTVTDKFKGNKPDRIDRYRPADQTLILSSPLWQQVWHCSSEPTRTSDGYTWKTANGKVATLKTPSSATLVKIVDEKVLWAKATTNFIQSELKWQIRFCSDEPSCEMTTVFEVK